MDNLLYIGFVLTSIALIIVPGPNVLVITSTSISHGTKRGLQTVLGTSLAMVFQLFIAASGTAWVVASINQGFYILKWLGIAYLLYLGISYLAGFSSSKQGPDISASAMFTRGFVVSLTNPKTILFFSAFLPQFAIPSGDYVAQIFILSITFLALAMILDSLYAILAGRVGRFIQGKKTHNRFSGLLYTGAAIWLASLKKT